VPLSLTKIEKELHSCKLYKSGDTAINAHKGKVNKLVLILSTIHKDITVTDNSKKTTETVLLIQ